MEKVYDSIEQLIGNTPLFEAKNLERRLGLQSRLLIKLELFNPAGSAKDRAALYMLDDGEKRGLVDKDTVIIEPTSGNTGIGLAAIGAARGYKVIIVMPDSMSVERIRIMQAYGAEVVLTPGALGMKGAIAKAEELAAGFEKAFIPGQFDNPANALAHYETTGPEIYNALEGKIDIFVAGIGTGGTITGIGRYLKEQNPLINVVGMEPADSPLLSKGISGPHKLQGIGANFVPSVLDRELLDNVVTVSSEEAFEMVRLLGNSEGIFVGISSGAAVAAAAKLAKLPENKGKTIVALAPDTGERYLSSELFG